MAVSAAMGFSARADPVPCTDLRFQVDADAETAEMICSAAHRAAEQLSSCGLEISDSITFSTTDQLDAGCIGLYHCGEGRVEILNPDAYRVLLEEGHGGAFAHLSPDVFFESVVRHELAHVALADLPCPFESCLVGQEYVAYTMQVRFLPESDRLAFEAEDPHDGPVSRDVLNPMILMMAPDLFARRAWQHLTERPDACDFIGQIASGTVLLDYERP